MSLNSYDDIILILIISTPVAYNFINTKTLKANRGCLESFILEDGSINVDDVIKKINKKTKMISLVHMSNVTGSITDFSQINKVAQKNNIPLLIDGCQHIAHKNTDVKDSSIVLSL